MKSPLLLLLALLCAIALGSAPAAAADRAPTIKYESVTGLTTTNAVLRAGIDPHESLTMYKLQIDTTGNFRFDQSSSCPLYPPGAVCLAVMIFGDPLPEGLVEPPESVLLGGTGVQEVSVNLAAIGAVLQPGTTYHFRAIAANTFGFTFGPDLTFTTPTVPPVEEEPPITLEIGEPKPPAEEEPLPEKEPPPEEEPPDEGEVIEDPEFPSDDPASISVWDLPKVDAAIPGSPGTSSTSKPRHRKRHTKRPRRERGRHGVAVHHRSIAR